MKFLGAQAGDAISVIERFYLSGYFNSTGGVLLTFVELVHGSVAIPIVPVVVPVIVSTAVCPSTTSDISAWRVYHV